MIAQQSNSEIRDAAIERMYQEVRDMVRTQIRVLRPVGSISTAEIKENVELVLMCIDAEHYDLVDYMDNFDGLAFLGLLYDHINEHSDEETRGDMGMELVGHLIDAVRSEVRA